MYKQEGKNIPFYVTDFKLEHIIKFVHLKKLFIGGIVNIHSLEGSTDAFRTIRSYRGLAVHWYVNL